MPASDVPVGSGILIVTGTEKLVLGEKSTVDAFGVKLDVLIGLEMSDALKEGHGRQTLETDLSIPCHQDRTYTQSIRRGTFNVGRVIVINNPPALSSATVKLILEVMAPGGNLASTLVAVLTVSSTTSQGRMNDARHVNGCRMSREARAYHATDDVA